MKSKSSEHIRELTFPERSARSLSSHRSCAEVSPRWQLPLGEMDGAGGEGAKTLLEFAGDEMENPFRRLEPC